MQIESLSIKSSTITIFGMMAFIAIILSLLAGSYFKQSAINAQANSLSRVIEVASQEILSNISHHAFELGTKLGHSKQLISLVNSMDRVNNTAETQEQLVKLLDDPFINGFVGFANIDLKAIKVYNLNFELIAQNSTGSGILGSQPVDYILEKINKRKGVERLKAIDALWLSDQSPLFSTLVPLGGLQPVGYLEIIVNPAFSLPSIGKITNTPVRIYSISGELINASIKGISNKHLPVAFTLKTASGSPAFRVVGYENIDALNKEMEKTLVITVGGFLIFSLSTLLFALWLFNRFLFLPVNHMLANMEKITHGELDLTISNKGLREFHIFANAFNAMTEQVRMRSNDLQRLLDLDDNALMCFDHDSDAVYFNEAAGRLLGYANNEITDLDIADLFAENISILVANATNSNRLQPGNLHTQLSCKHKGGHIFQSAAIIKTVDVMGRSGFAIALNSTFMDNMTTTSQHDLRLHAVEQTLSNLLTFAKDNTALGQDHKTLASVTDTASASQKAIVREHVVKIMNLALTCWEHDSGKTKLKLAEESKIWPVYIDKSTPTTRTLDKYLNINSCPKNPRNQRAIDTAEFVLRKTKKHTSIKSKELQQALDAFRQLLSGIKAQGKS